MSTLAKDLYLAAPLMILPGGGVFLLLLDAFSKGIWSRPLVTALFVMLSFSVLLSTASSLDPGSVIFMGALYADPLSLVSTSIVLLGLLVTIMLGSGMVGSGKSGDGLQEQQIEFYALLLFSSSGAVIFANSADLLTLFVGLELMSLPLYCLCAADRLRRGSSEAALKYFILGSFSSAILLLGIALVYGIAGTTSIVELSGEVGEIDVVLLYFALTLIVAGLVFKLGGIPFHFWIPDVYEGAPTVVTVFMASVIKAASVIAAVRVAWSAFGDLQFFWTRLLAVIAIITMIGGNLMALPQASVKRLLAYSSIAHVGYILIGFLALRQADEQGAAAAILYYVIAYSLASAGAFGVVYAICGTEEEHNVSNFSGLAKTRPFMAFVMLLFLFSLAGLPPGMGGLLAKVYVFYSAVQAGYTWLVVLAVIASAVSVYYYLRIILHMYFLPSEGPSPHSANRSIHIALAVCAIAVVLMGVFPAPLNDLCSYVVQGL